MDNPQYIGDGAYVEYDGYGVKLMANSHDHPTDVVYLEPAALTQFITWLRGTPLCQLLKEK